MTATYQIEKRTPATRLHVIHRGYDVKSVEELFLDILATGAELVTSGDTHLSVRDLRADGTSGDLIEYRAVTETTTEEE